MLFAFFIYSCSCHQNRSHCRHIWSPYYYMDLFIFIQHIKSKTHTNDAKHIKCDWNASSAWAKMCCEQILPAFRKSSTFSESFGMGKNSKQGNKKHQTSGARVRVRVIWFLMFEILIKSNWYEIVRACECMCAKTTPSGTRNRAINVCIHDMEFALKINYSRFGGVQFYNK